MDHAVHLAIDSVRSPQVSAGKQIDRSALRSSPTIVVGCADGEVGNAVSVHVARRGQRCSRTVRRLLAADQIRRQIGFVWIHGKDIARIGHAVAVRVWVCVVADAVAVEVR